MSILPEGVFLDFGKANLYKIFLFVVIAMINHWIISKRKISKQRAERLVIHLEYIGTIVIAVSIIGNTGVSTGNFPIIVQIFNPWPALLFLFTAYQLKLALNANWLHGELIPMRDQIKNLAKNRQETHKKIVLVKPVISEDLPSLKESSPERSSAKDSVKPDHSQ